MVDKILGMKDERAQLEALDYNLTSTGYKVDTSVDGRAAIENARQFTPDMVVLEVMLPLIDSYEVCRGLGQQTNLQNVMLTACNNEMDRAIELQMGADDYIPKPFSMRELRVPDMVQLPA